MKYEVDEYIVEHVQENDMDKYYIYFKDSIGNECKLEIQKKIFDAYINSKKSYVKIKNQKTRHEEQSEQTEISLYKRSLNQQKSVENEFIESITKEKLKAAKKQLTEKQIRRIELHYMDEVTIRDLAIMENVRKNQVEKSIKLGIKKIKKFFEN